MSKKTPSQSSSCYEQNCTACPRLADFLAGVRDTYPTYFAYPVAPFGPVKARFMVVGLAPGLHGANRTGRPFTGDWCGPLLYSSLHKYGFANQAESVARDDGLQMLDCRVTNAVKCLPPENKPTPAEIRECNHFLKNEIDLIQPQIILALGSIAHQAVVQAQALKKSAYPFGHHAVHTLPSGATLIDSYHVSRYNTQTKRLTEAMFHAVLADVRARLDGVGKP